MWHLAIRCYVDGDVHEVDESSVLSRFGCKFDAGVIVVEVIDKLSQLGDAVEPD